MYIAYIYWHSLRLVAQVKHKVQTQLGLSLKGTYYND